MPNLDGGFASLDCSVYDLSASTGVSATSIIRQFNSSTPIISMTSNSEPDDILTYFSHGAVAASTS
jgi:CheY-like chemotaxis protein